MCTPIYYKSNQNGFSRLIPSAITLSLSLRTLSLGAACTVWTGIGAIGAFVVGIVALGEQLSAMQVLAAVPIVCGLVLMKLTSH